MRIAVGGIHTECSTYNPLLARLEDFTVLRGAEIPAAADFAVLGEWDWQILPTLHARAIPGGPVERATYEALKAEFLDRLQASLPIDGLYLAMHGAMNVEGMDDAEGDWIAAARAIVGDECPISTSYDLHGNVSERVIDAIDMFSAYRTAPHIDVTETKRRALALLHQRLTTDVRPFVVWAKVPVLLPGERTSTVDEPAKSLYARLPEVDAVPGVLDASIMVGYVWADEPRATASIIMTGTDRAVLAAEAVKLAAACWEARNDFVFGPKTGSIEECLDWAAEAGTKPVIFAESGDNPTGGGVGDRADVLGAVLARGASHGKAVFAGITDAPATEAAYAAGVGATVTLSIGATLDPSSTPVSVVAEVAVLLDVAEPARREAVVRAGDATIILTARRRPFHDIADFTKFGFHPGDFDLVVVKSGYLSPELAPLANPNLMALSEGVVDQDIPRIANVRRTRPVFPFDADFAFTPRATPSKRAPG
ncbi:M81 family metallopeptidase [Kaistia dalseonensis]|uniref:Microcystinase C n=1 Tax=Kaistia dalseonensis TaxID=410840 RepID=A0ABU0H6G0_9HYPH|nr:M81 family metallopeptidase [Kaistia dalseonensis]MCX5495295.1 M81 family metallopeptidase [Kaistia dalseonensis]MDQ0437881.1 microcystin degradation protein MlrC [Kaistia dalseonensis]